MSKETKQPEMAPAVSITDLLAVLGKTAPGRDITASKAHRILSRCGGQITGFVVTNQYAEHGIIAMSAVRWLSNKDMWWLMHESKSRIRPASLPKG